MFNKWGWSIFALVLTAIPFSARAATIDVANATQLQNALDIAQSNNQPDIINLAPGPYDASGGTFTYPSNPVAAVAENFPLTIQGGDPTTTILDGGDAMQILNIDTTGLTADNNADITVQGITFQKGNDMGNAGGALLILTFDADILVTGSRFLDNHTNLFGGGLYLQGGTFSGGSGNAEFSSNLVTGNTSDGGAGGAGIEVQSGSAIVSNNIFFDNHANGGPAGGLDIEFLDAPPIGGALTLVNNTIFDNTSSGFGGGVRVQFSESGEAINIYNNIISGNTGTGLGNDLLIENNATGTDINVFNNDLSDICFTSTAACDPAAITDVAQGNNKNVDPFLLNPANGDFNLGEGSEAIDAGDSGAPNLPATDFAGNPRIIGPAPDMGALEALPEIAATPSSLNFGSVDQNTQSTLILTLTNNGAGVLEISTFDLSDDINYTVNPALGDIPCGSMTPTVQSQQNCTVGVIFEPTAQGNFNGTLTVDSNDPDDPQLDIPLTGSTPSGGGCALMGAETSYPWSCWALGGLSLVLFAIRGRRLQ